MNRSCNVTNWLKSKSPAVVAAVLAFRLLQLSIAYTFKLFPSLFHEISCSSYFIQVPILVATLIFADKMVAFFRDKPVNPIFGVVGLVVLLIPVHFEVRSHVDVSGVNGSRATSYSKSSLPFELKCYVGRDTSPDGPVLVNMDIIGAEAEHYVDDIYNIRLMLTNEGAKRIRSVTTENVGSELSFYIDGVFVVAARIHEPIDQNSIVFPAEFSQMEAEGVAEGIVSLSKRGVGVTENKQ